MRTIQVKNLAELVSRPVSIGQHEVDGVLQQALLIGVAGLVEKEKAVDLIDGGYILTNKTPIGNLSSQAIYLGL